MTKDQESELAEILQFGHGRHWIMIEQKLHEFIEKITEDAFRRGQLSTLPD